MRIGECAAQTIGERKPAAVELGMGQKVCGWTSASDDVSENIGEAGGGIGEVRSVSSVALLVVAVCEEWNVMWVSSAVRVGNINWASSSCETHWYVYSSRLLTLESDHDSSA